MAQNLHTAGFGTENDIWYHYRWFWVSINILLDFLN